MGRRAAARSSPRSPRARCIDCWAGAISARARCRRWKPRSSRAISRSGGTPGGTRTGPTGRRSCRSRIATSPASRCSARCSAITRSCSGIKPVRVWGWSTPGDTVSVSIAGGFGHCACRFEWSMARDDSRRCKAGGPYTLNVRAESGAIATSKDILVRRRVALLGPVEHGPAGAIARSIRARRSRDPRTIRSACSPWIS